LKSHAALSARLKHTDANNRKIAAIAESF